MIGADYRAAGGLVPRPRASERTRRLFRRAPTVRGVATMGGWRTARHRRLTIRPCMWTTRNLFVPSCRLTDSGVARRNERFRRAFSSPATPSVPSGRAVERETKVRRNRGERERNLRVE